MNLSLLLVRLLTSTLLMVVGGVIHFFWFQDRWELVLVLGLGALWSLYFLGATDHRLQRLLERSRLRVADRVVIHEFEKLVHGIRDESIPAEEQVQRLISLLTFAYVDSCHLHDRNPVAALTSQSPAEDPADA